jgi:hypothetical protein
MAARQLDGAHFFLTSQHALGEFSAMDVLVPDWSDWTALKTCEVRPSLVSSARVGQPMGLMRGAGFHAAPASAISVLGPFVAPAEEPEPEPAAVAAE